MTINNSAPSAVTIKLTPGCKQSWVRLIFDGVQTKLPQNVRPSYWIFKLMELEKYVQGLPHKVSYTSLERSTPHPLPGETASSLLQKGTQRGCEGTGLAMSPMSPSYFVASLLPITSRHSSALQQPGTKLLNVNTTLSPHFLPVSCKMYMK